MFGVFHGIKRSHKIGIKRAFDGHTERVNEKEMAGGPFRVFVHKIGDISIFVDKSNASCSISSCNRWALMDDIHIHTQRQRAGGGTMQWHKTYEINNKNPFWSSSLRFFRAKRQNSRVHFPSWASIARTLHTYIYDMKGSSFFLSFFRFMCAVDASFSVYVASFHRVFLIWHLFLSAFSIFFTTNMVPINISLVYKRHNIKGTLLHIEFHVCVRACVYALERGRHININNSTKYKYKYENKQSSI